MRIAGFEEGARLLVSQAVAEERILELQSSKGRSAGFYAHEAVEVLIRFGRPRTRPRCYPGYSGYAYLPEGAASPEDCANHSFRSNSRPTVKILDM